jgi:hypothetical protein
VVVAAMVAETVSDVSCHCHSVVAYWLALPWTMKFAAAVALVVLIDWPRRRLWSIF